jgi:hypothetical protein
MDDFDPELDPLFIRADRAIAEAKRLLGKSQDDVAAAKRASRTVRSIVAGFRPTAADGREPYLLIFPECG